MPIYKYRCQACGTLSEVIARISDPKPEACPACGANALTKAVARTAFRLSGGGWYAQGYDGASNTSVSDSGGGDD